MPAAYTPIATNNPATIPLVSDGDPPNAASVGVPMQALADREAWSRKNLDGVKTVQSGGQVKVVAGGSIRCETGSTFTCATGATALFASSVVTFDNACTWTCAADPLFTGSASFSGEIRLIGTAGLLIDSTGTLTCTATSHVVFAAGCTWTCHAAALFDGITTFNGEVIHNADVAIATGNALTIPTGATIALAGIVQPAGAGRAHRRPIYPGDFDLTFTIANGDLLVATSISGTKTWTIDTTGAVDDDEMRIAPRRNAGTVGTLIVNWGNGTLSFANATDVLGAFVDLVFHSGGWQCVGASLGFVGTGF